MLTEDYNPPVLSVHKFAIKDHLKFVNLGVRPQKIAKCTNFFLKNIRCGTPLHRRNLQPALQAEGKAAVRGNPGRTHSVKIYLRSLRHRPDKPPRITRPREDHNEFYPLRRILQARVDPFDAIRSDHVRNHPSRGRRVPSGPPRVYRKRNRRIHPKNLFPLPWSAEHLHNFCPNAKHN